MLHFSHKTNSGDRSSGGSGHGHPKMIHTHRSYKSTTSSSSTTSSHGGPYSPTKPMAYSNNPYYGNNGSYHGSTPYTSTYPSPLSSPPKSSPFMGSPALAPGNIDIKRGNPNSYGKSSSSPYINSNMPNAVDMTGKNRMSVTFVDPSQLDRIPPKKVIQATTNYTGTGNLELSFSKGDFYFVLQELDNHYFAYNPLERIQGIVPKDCFSELDKNMNPNTKSAMNIPYRNSPTPSKTVISPPATNVLFDTGIKISNSFNRNQTLDYDNKNGIGRNTYSNANKPSPIQTNPINSPHSKSISIHNNHSIGHRNNYGNYSPAMKSVVSDRSNPLSTSVGSNGTSISVPLSPSVTGNKKSVGYSSSFKNKTYRQVPPKKVIHSSASQRRNEKSRSNEKKNEDDYYGMDSDRYRDSFGEDDVYDHHYRRDSDSDRSRNYSSSRNGRNSGSSNSNRDKEEILSPSYLSHGSNSPQMHRYERSQSRKILDRFNNERNSNQTRSSLDEDSRSSSQSTKRATDLDEHEDNNYDTFSARIPKRGESVKNKPTGNGLFIKNKKNPTPILSPSKYAIESESEDSGLYDLELEDKIKALNLNTYEMEKFNSNNKNNDKDSRDMSDDLNSNETDDEANDSVRNKRSRRRRANAGKSVINLSQRVITAILRSQRKVKISNITLTAISDSDDEEEDGIDDIEYELEVFKGDGKLYVLYRTYAEFKKLLFDLLQEFPEKAGLPSHALSSKLSYPSSKSTSTHSNSTLTNSIGMEKTQIRTLPYLVAKEYMTPTIMDSFLQYLVQQPREVQTYDTYEDFFDLHVDLKDSDIDADSNYLSSDQSQECVGKDYTKDCRTFSFFFDTNLDEDDEEDDYTNSPYGYGMKYSPLSPKSKHENGIKIKIINGKDIYSINVDSKITYDQLKTKIESQFMSSEINTNSYVDRISYTNEFGVDTTLYGDTDLKMLIKLASSKLIFYINKKINY